MSLDLSNLTDSAQKEYSKLLRDIKFQKGVIEKCKVYSKESPSDALKRARAGYEHNKRQYDEHDTILEERIERMISKLREEGARDKESKAKYLQASEEKLETLESEKSRQQVNAELELDKLNHSLEALKDTVRISTVQQAPRISAQTFNTSPRTCSRRPRSAR
jgi:dynactin complex subunit